MIYLFPYSFKREQIGTVPQKIIEGPSSDQMDQKVGNYFYSNTDTLGILVYDLTNYNNRYSPTVMNTLKYVA